jgi:hypothetical protein
MNMMGFQSCFPLNKWLIKVSKAVHHQLRNYIIAIALLYVVTNILAEIIKTLWLPFACFMSLQYTTFTLIAASC